MMKPVEYLEAVQMPLPYCVYILFSEKDHLLYTGYSANLGKRIETHNAGGNISTANRRPLQLIFCEFYLFKEDAQKREMYFKTTMGKKAIRLMLAGSMVKLGYNQNGSKIQIDFDSGEADL